MSTGASQRSASSMVQPLRAGVVLDLVALDLADAEVVAVGMREVEAGDGRAGPHGVALGQLDAGGLVARPSASTASPSRCGRAAPDSPGAGRMPRYFSRMRSSLESVSSRGVAPELAAHARVQALGEGFGEAVAQRLEDDAAVVVGRGDARSDRLLLADAGGHGEAADVVGEPGLLRRDEIGERGMGAVARRIAGDLLAQRVQRRQLAACASRRCRARCRRRRCWPARSR